MTADPSSPAGRSEHASHEHPAEEHPDPATFAHGLLEHLAFVHGDTNADLYASCVVAELRELSPLVREHISDPILAELVEDLHRRGKAECDAAQLVGRTQRDWMQGHR